MSDEWVLGVDVGGTFTDLVAVGAGRVLATAKVLTTYPDPTPGVFAGIESIEAGGLRPTDCVSVTHATTLASNALLQGRIARTAAVVTQGFSDVLTLRGENRYDIYSPENPLPKSLVAPTDYVPLDERVSASGELLRRADIGPVLPTLDRLFQSGVACVAICFLHSYAEPRNERQIEREIHERWPSVRCVCSSDVLGEAREYERFTAAVLDAALHPVISDYLGRLEHQLLARGYERGHFAMTSSGDVVTFERAASRPILLLESGPAAGHVAACRIAERIGREVISFDVGGTTAKVGVSAAMRPVLTKSLEVARVAPKAGSGHPIALQSVELHEIGSGGGSIAHVNAIGLMEVGPISAGSDPGPACYGRGGEQPTVTDANLALGYLNPDGRLGGTLSVDLQLALTSLGSLAEDGVGAAVGVRRVVDEQMAEAIRLHVVESQVDPSERILVASGGGGPIHAAIIADALNIPLVYCPREAGVLSAWGMALAPLASRTSLTRFIDAEGDDFQSQWSAGWREVESRLEQPRGASAHYFDRAVEMLYEGQTYAIYVGLGRTEVASAAMTADELDALFSDAYRRRYGRAVQGGKPIVTALHLAAVFRQEQELAPLSIDSTEEPPSERGSSSRRVHLGGSFVEAEIVEWPGNPTSWRVSGPAVVEGQYSAAVVPLGWRAMAIGDGDLVLERVQHEEQNGRLEQGGRMLRPSVTAATSDPDILHDSSRHPQ